MSELFKKSPVAEAILQQLKDPFATNLVKYAQVGGGKLISFVDARDVMKRLDTVVGTENWEDEYTRTDGGMICKLTIVIDGKKVTKSGAANDTKIAPIKGAESGSFKRAAVKFGVGRYLYYFDPLQWRANNQADWPSIFKPGAPEDWENVAEETYGVVTNGEEEFGEFGETVINNLDKIRASKTSSELLEVFNSLDSAQQAALGVEFKQRSDEILAKEQEDILKNAKKESSNEQ